MAYHINIKNSAIKLRRLGYSLNEIHDKLKVSKSVISGWVRDLSMSEKAKTRLLKKIKIGQFISAENKKRKTRQIIETYFEKAIKNLRRVRINDNLSKLICSLIYWCEGTKNLNSGISFANSDPQLVRTFLKLFRNSFNLDENKFRVCVHLHEYHNSKKQLKFWSDVTGINQGQFLKPFLKKNTGKIIRNDYNGCVSIRYHDTAIARQLLMTAKAFLTKY